MFRTLTIILATLWLTACAGVSQYSVSESELEKALYTQLEEQAPALPRAWSKPASIGST